MTVFSKMIGDKRRWRQYKARTRQLPPNYRAAIDAVERYLLYVGGRGDGPGWASMRALYARHCFFCSSDPVMVSIQLGMVISLLRRSRRSVHGGAVRCVL